MRKGNRLPPLMVVHWNVSYMRAHQTFANAGHEKTALDPLYFEGCTTKGI